MTTKLLLTGLQPGSYIRARDLFAALTISKSTARRWVMAGEMPAPVCLGSRTKVWRVDAVREWLDAKGQSKIA